SLRRVAVSVKTLLPFLLSLLALPDEWREGRDVEDQPVDERGRETQRLHEVDEQYDAGLVGLVPGLVLIRVVADQDLSFLRRAARDIHAGCDCRRRRVRHEQA